MCGIAGLIGGGGRRVLQEMVNAQSHRGPDDEGIWSTRAQDGSWVGLGSRRLAILDLSDSGHMPMSTPDDRYTIVYNGEIYNYPDLKSKLQKRGYRFRSETDTEVVLYSYSEWGSKCLQYLRGMFSFGIWDERRQLTFLARDHFGIKPLYYYKSDRKLAFASELKGLLKWGEVDCNIDYNALHQYLTLLWVPDPLTIIDNILKLPAGHYAIFKNGELTTKEYWDPTFPAADYDYNTDEADLKTELKRRFIDTVEEQLLSDVPVGAFLSAGLDSSSIVAAMAERSPDPVRTFTVAFPKKDRQGEVHLDDPNVAQRTADHFGCNHTQIQVEPDVVDLLPKITWHMDEPTADPAIIMAYLINREASRDATVLLSGIGGDEVFAGYRKYYAHYLSTAYRKWLPSTVREQVIEPAIQNLPAMRGTSLKGYVRLAKKMARSGSLPPQESFLMNSTYLTDKQKHGLYTPAVRAQIGNTNPKARHLSYFDRVDHADFLNQMLYLDMKTFMVSLNLNYNDKMSMASSVEVRVPFLDPELVEWVAWNVPPELKLRGRTTKYILREAMKPMLPDEVLTQKKAGFGAPIDYWLANDLRGMVDELLSREQIKQRGIFQPDAVRRFVEEQRKGIEDWSMQVWQFLTLELWMREFID